MDRSLAHPIYPLLLSSLHAAQPNFSLHELNRPAVSNSRLNAETRIKRRRHIGEADLPPEVRRLEKNGSIVYLIGTAHLSNASNEQVGHIIDQVQPDRVMVELCDERRALMYQTQVQQTVSWSEMRQVVRSKGVGQAMLLLPLLFASSGASNQLHSMPGAEFRVARQHCDRVPGCNTVLGDRKLSVTIQRMFRLMSPFEKLKFVGSMLWDSISSITSDEIENMKDEVSEMLEEMRTGYPGVYHIILDERNVYLTAMLQATIRQPQKITTQIHPSGHVPPVVVAIVGIGHQAGIVKLFDNAISRDEFESLKTIPALSTANQVAAAAFNISKYGLIAWVVYKLAKKCRTLPTGSAIAFKGVKVL